MTAPDASYTGDAIGALKVAARTEHDFAGWLAAVLAVTPVSCGCGHSVALRTPGTPRSRGGSATPGRHDGG